jgi:hypothetical protein
LRRAALPQFKKTLLDVIARLGKQPLTQMLQDFLDLSPPLRRSVVRGDVPSFVTSAVASSVE